MSERGARRWRHRPDVAIGRYPEVIDALRREDDGGWGASARPRASPERPRSTSRRARRRARRGLVGARRAVPVDERFESPSWSRVWRYLCGNQSSNKKNKSFDVSTAVPERIRTADTRFKVLGANHYTTGTSARVTERGCIYFGEKIRLVRRCDKFLAPVARSRTHDCFPHTRASQQGDPGH